MLKASLFLVIIAVLFKGALSDFQCFGDKLKSILKDGVFDERTALCSEVRALVDQLLKYGEDCSYTFDGDKVKEVLLEFCDDNSELFKSIKENEECLESNMLTSGCTQSFFWPDSRASAVENCQRKGNNYQGLTLQFCVFNPKSSLSMSCNSTFHHVRGSSFPWNYWFTDMMLENSLSDCYEEKVGRPCGERALRGVRSLVGVFRTMVVCDAFETSYERYRRIRWYIILGIGVPGAICLGLLKLCKTNKNERKTTPI